MALQKAKSKFIQLIKKIVSGKASVNEQSFVEKYYKYFDAETGYLTEIPQPEKKAIEGRIYDGINERISGNNTLVVKIPVYRRLIFKASVAAAILLIIYTGINLDKTANRQASQKIVASIFNTITTPKGATKKIVLPDGTRVWMNAASTLRFPTAFTNNERVVELNGEAYFEVAHNARKPFRVKVKGQTVEVLGTRFNLMAYDEEPVVKTTLLEGKVKVSANKNQVVLHPGEQSVLTKNATDQLTVSAINGNDVIAWKKGKFLFNQSDIYSVMREISRWYDMDIECKDSLHLHIYLNGSISRDVPLAKVLKILELTGEVKFTVLNNRIKILKK